MKKIGFVLFVGIFCLVVAEVSIRLVGEFLSLDQYRRNVINESDTDAIRILCFGESTTADFYEDQVNSAWPRQLERLLNQEGIGKFRVYSEGRPSYDTGIISSILESSIEKYKPHIVITMMGINDIEMTTEFTGGLSSHWQIFLRRLRLVKVWKYFFSHLKPLNMTELSVEERKTLALSFSQLNPSPSIFSKKESLSVSADSIWSQYWQNVYEENAFDSEKWFQSKLQWRERLTQAVIANPKHDELLWEAMDNEYLAEEFKRCFDIAVVALENSEDSTMAINHIVKCGRQIPAIKTQIETIARQKLGLTFTNLQPLEVTARHYRYFRDYLKREKIHWIVLQYPLQSLSSMRWLVYGRQDIPPVNSFRAAVENQQTFPFVDSKEPSIYFVEQRSSFVEVMKEHPWNEVFTDRFAGRFGHTTALGHQIIANNAAQAVLEWFKNQGH